MKIFQRLVLSIGLLSSLSATAQITDSLSTVRGDKISSLKDYFKKADYGFYSRTFFMSTLNNGALKDDFTMAQGGGLSMLTPSLAGFQFGVSGYFMFKLASSDLNQPDLTTGLKNRYEIGQYDITQPTNFQNLYRLEDLFLRYTYKKSSLTVGRMTLNTPFMNPQDGRMRPTVEEGVWLQVNEHPKFGFRGGFIWGVSPRSTTKFYRMQYSPGIYPSGLNTDGTKSNYAGNIKSAGLAMANLYVKPTKNLEINIWDAYFDQVFNTLILEIKNKISFTDFDFYQAGMYVRQDAVNYGGNANPANTYIDKGAYANAASLQAGIKTKKIDWNLNYTHITGDGRFLNPREWGRDFFYTFMPRERNEGAGNVHAITTNFTYQTLSQKLKLGFSYGYFKLPDVTNVRLNKYAMPYYHQINMQASYHFMKIFKGLEIKLLVVGKINDNKVLAAKYIYNKVNMINFNLIFDFKM